MITLEGKHKMFDILERQGIDPERIKWTFKTTTEGRPLEMSFDDKNPEYQRLFSFLEDLGGSLDSTEFHYWILKNKRVIGRRKHTW